MADPLCVCNHLKSQHKPFGEGVLLGCMMEGCACRPGCIHDGFVEASKLVPVDLGEEGRYFIQATSWLARLRTAEARATTAEATALQLKQDLAAERLLHQELKRRESLHDSTSWGRLESERNYWKSVALSWQWMMLGHVVVAFEEIKSDVAGVLRWKQRALDAEGLLADLRRRIGMPAPQVQAGDG